MNSMQMTDTSVTPGSRLEARLLALGAAMTGVGTIVVATGAATVGLSLAMMGRRWIQSRETPPIEIGRRTFVQARTASRAGLEAWRGAGASSSGVTTG